MQRRALFRRTGVLRQSMMGPNGPMHNDGKIHAQTVLEHEAKRQLKLLSEATSKFEVTTKVRSDSSRVIGIDLGTTNSCISYIDKESGLPKIIPAPTGSWVYPTAITFDRNHTIRLFGEEARACARTSASATLCSGKRLIGRRFGELGRVQSQLHKTNVLTFCGDTWFRAFNEIGEKDYPDVKRDYNHVDACCMWFVKSPEFYDTIVVPNMFGDIITDLAAIIQGGLGVAAGGNINPDRGGVSMYEPMGGSAPKYTGQDVINPIAAIGAIGMLLANTTAKDAATTKAMRKAGARVDAAIKATTPKMKSQAAGKMGYGTQAVGDLVCEAL